MKLAALLLTLSGYVVLIQGSHRVLVPHPGGIGGIFKGPNSETIVKGPDGSIITAADEGGAVKTGIETIAVPAAVPVATAAITSVLVEESVPVAAAPLLPVAQPGPITHQNVIIGTKRPHIIKTELVDAPIVEPNESSDLVGPSGSISTRGSSSIVSGPASTTISESVKTVIAPAPILPVVTSVGAPVGTILHPGPKIGLEPRPIITDGSPIVPVASSTILPPASLPVLAAASVMPQIAHSNLAVEIVVPSAASTLPPPTLPASTAYTSLGEGQHIQIQPQLEYSTPVPHNYVQRSFSRGRNNIRRPLFTASSAPVVKNTPTLAPAPQLGSTVYNSQGNGQNIQIQPQLEYSTPLSENYNQNSRLFLANSAQPEQNAFSSTLTQSSLENTININTQQPQDNYLVRQIGINPANIPSRNIVPPEIRLPPLPKGAIDLGATVTVTSVPIPKAPGIVASSPASIIDQNLNQGDNTVIYNGRNVEGNTVLRNQERLPQEQNSGLYLESQNEGRRSSFTEPREPDWRGALLRNPSIIEQQSNINSQLNQQGIDSSQINFEQIPLSSAIGTLRSNYDVYEDAGLELANRYGKRKVIS